MSPLKFQSLYSTILSDLEVKLKELLFASARHISPDGIVSTASKDLNLVVDHLKGSILINGGKANNISEMLSAAQLIGNLISGVRGEPPSTIKLPDLPEPKPEEIPKPSPKAPTVLQEKPKEFLPDILP